MGDNKSIFRISVGASEFEVTGSDFFVNQQIERFSDAIEAILENASGIDTSVPLITNQSAKVAAVQEPGLETVTSQNISEFYPSVLDLSDGKVIVIKGVSGSTAEKQVKLSIMYLRGLELIGDKKTATGSELRKLCQDHACFDSNFASNLKKRKEWLIVEGTKGGNLEYRLTHPGREQVETLLKELNGE